MAATAEAVKADKAATKPRVIMPVKKGQEHWAMHEEVLNVFRAVIPAANTLEDLTRTSMWTYVADQLRPFDMIIALHENREFWAELLVLDARPGYANVTVLRKVETLPALDNSTDEPLMQQYEISRAIDGTWGAIRKVDRVPMGDSFESYDKLRRHILDHASNRA